MNKIKLIFGSMAAMLFFACAPQVQQVSLKENWIDERDVMALVGSPVSEWMVKAGRPTLVEINGDTGIYYYNYKPTMYAVAVYGKDAVQETKPSIVNATEVWGSRKNVMQIKVVNDLAVSAVISDGPDRKAFIRDLNGDLVLDPKTGFLPNYSSEQRIDFNYSEYVKAYSSIINPAPAPAAVVPAQEPVPVVESVDTAPVAPVVEPAPQAPEGAPVQEHVSGHVPEQVPQHTAEHAVVPQHVVPEHTPAEVHHVPAATPAVVPEASHK